MSAHTPGPWVEGESGDILAPNSESRHLFVAVAARWREGRPQEEQAANARLIAAAPELLEACENLTDGLRPDSRCDVCGVNGEHLYGCPVPLAKRAVAKARGES